MVPRRSFHTIPGAVPSCSIEHRLLFALGVVLRVRARADARGKRYLSLQLRTYSARTCAICFKRVPHCRVAAKPIGSDIFLRFLHQTRTRISRSESLAATIILEKLHYLILIYHKNKLLIINNGLKEVFRFVL